jgi:hypothetical protein
MLSRGSNPVSRIVRSRCARLRRAAVRLHTEAKGWCHGPEMAAPPAVSAMRPPTRRARSGRRTASGTVQALRGEQLDRRVPEPAPDPTPDELVGPGAAAFSVVPAHDRVVENQHARHEGPRRRPVTLMSGRRQVPGRGLSGAGDSFAAGLTYALGEGRSVEDALALAARAGAACMTGRGPYEGQLRTAV